MSAYSGPCRHCGHALHVQALAGGCLGDRGRCRCVTFEPMPADAAGGGKSDALLMAALQYVDGPGVTWPGAFAPRRRRRFERFGPLALPVLIFKAWRLRRKIRRSERGEQ